MTIETPSTRTWFDRLGWWLWVALLVTIPVTSFPMIAGWTGGSTVSPLSGLPMLALLVLWVPSRLRRLGRLSRALTALAAFAAAALASSALAHFLPILPRFDETLLAREIRALVTLGVGIGFYVVAYLMPRSDEEVRSSLRWLYVGAAILLLYSLYQALALPGADHPVSEDYLAFHRLFSIRDPFRDRLTGLAYEPSWLGNQLVVLYLPLLLASVTTGVSVFRSLRRRVSLEATFLVVGLFVLFLSFARLAWLSFLLAAGWWFASSLAGWIGHRAYGRAGPSARPAWRARLMSWLGTGVAVGLVALLLVLVGSIFDERLAKALQVNLGTLSASADPWPYVLANRLRYAERLMYWVAGFRVFSVYPLFGVGLGNAGFLMPDAVPAFATLLPEIVEVMVHGSSGLPNPKSLWIRLLAETGIVGFSFFVAWLGLSLASANRLLRRASPLARTLGLAAILAVVAQVSEGFSLDTFALPQLWVILGVMSALSSRETST